MFRSVKYLPLLGFILLVACSAEEPTPLSYNFGTPVSEAIIEKWNIDVGPDGAGLPEGSGTAETGEPIYITKCALCHGEFGEGMGRFPGFVGTPEDLVDESPSKNVGSYWGYATTLWDYIYRAMPFGNAQSLSPDEVYGITAYILSLNNIIAEDEVMNATSLPQVKMPNRNGFITATGADIHAVVCMQNCVKDINITSRASESQASLSAKDKEKDIGNYHR